MVSPPMMAKSPERTLGFSDFSNAMMDAPSSTAERAAATPAMPSPTMMISAETSSSTSSAAISGGLTGQG